MPIPETNDCNWARSGPARLPAEIGPSPAAVVPTAEIAAAVTFARAEKAEATRRAYRTDFEIFRTWCNERRVAELPSNAETVAAFLAFEASRAIRPSTIARRVAAIRYAHTLAGHEPPTNAETVPHVQNVGTNGRRCSSTATACSPTSICSPKLVS